MNPRHVYIIGPYAADTPDGIAANVRNAVNLARRVAEAGHAPYCIHAEIAAGVFGDDADPAQREAGLWLAAQRAYHAGATGMWLLVIRRPDGTLSAGTRHELQAWRDGRNAAPKGWRGDVIARTAEAWGRMDIGAALSVSLDAGPDRDGARAGAACG